MNNKEEITFKLLVETGPTIQNAVKGEHFVLTSEGIINLHEEGEEWAVLCMTYYNEVDYVIFDRYYLNADSLGEVDAI